MKDKVIPLPPEVKDKDLKYPSYKSKVKRIWDSDFELWYTERFGWCIPTLAISKARRGSGYQDRTYGISLSGETVTMGKGPHVLRTVAVYVTESNVKRLQKFISLKESGTGKAGDIRDRISTRRANTMARRNPFGGGLFGW